MILISTYFILIILSLLLILLLSKARRVDGSTHQVPIEIGSTQGKALAIRWLLGASQ
ncbi:hypothetical protein FGF99_24610 [Salmonella sp. gx-f8]|nr:hypothetical protein [Salmonella sp. gx-f8]